MWPGSPTRVRGSRTRATQSRATPLLYFIAIGLGYILAEIAFIQRFVLFLGHPTYALTVVIFLMLLAVQFSIKISRLSDQLKDLVQDNALMRHEFERLNERRTVDGGKG